MQSQIKKSVEDDEIIEEEQSSCYKIISLKPNTLIYNIWNGLMSILTLAQICKTVLLLGLDFTIQNKVLDEVVDAIFMFDILVNFFTLYIEDVELVSNWKKIVWHYVFEGPFIFDLIATIPTLVTFQMQQAYWFKII